MALSVVKDQTKFVEGRGEVVVTSDIKDHGLAISELTSQDARKLAIEYAASVGVPDPRVSGGVHHYPVDRDGAVLTSTKERPIAFQAAIPITKRLV